MEEINGTVKSVALVTTKFSKIVLRLKGGSTKVSQECPLARDFFNEVT